MVNFITFFPSLFFNCNVNLTRKFKKNDTFKFEQQKYLTTKYIPGRVDVLIHEFIFFPLVNQVICELTAIKSNDLHIFHMIHKHNFQVKKKTQIENLNFLHYFQNWQNIYVHF